MYISVPFCKAKCSYCNFASGVFGRGASGIDRMERYVERVCAEIHSSRARAAQMRAEMPEQVDTIYFGGGTPSLLSAGQMQRLFAALRCEFDVSADAEITIECAPGQVDGETLDALLRLGLNRVSFGVQSFVDAEARAVGRQHTRETCLAEIARMRAAGVEQINVDLIVGLPHQTAASWRESVDVALASAVPHLSVYMLEVDEESRLGREMLAHGARYGAASVPSEDETAEWYAAACERLEADGVRQYEISNFARARSAPDSNTANCATTACGALDFRSRHNVKYWHREPYLGFGLDAHSMLRTYEEDGRMEDKGAVRWANASDLETYLRTDNDPRSPNREGGEPAQFSLNADFAELRTAPGPLDIEWVGSKRGFEEAVFLGLRMNQGIDLEALRAEFGERLSQAAVAALGEVVEAGLVEREDNWARLTARGRMVSNEVFSRLLVAD